MTLDDLDGRLFATPVQAAEILGKDPRTIRRAAEAEEIPAKKVGRNWVIPVQWLREQAGVLAPPASAAPDLDELADRVADRLFARFVLLLGGKSREMA